ncbi:MAG: hypothetical protein QOE59_3552 [Actinomycetota bacterium]|nr:hypothetical protein [Actinomycetota bacterium]
MRTLVVVAIAAATPTACADAPVAAPAAPTAPAQHAADVAYAQMMTPHVGQGVELTDLVPGRAADPALSQLAQSMNHADVEEQGQLAGQLHLWQAPVPGEAGVPLTRMPGMADQATLERLRAMSGPAFDRAWLAAMIAHHQGGVDMSRDYLALGSGQALTGVAQAQEQVGTTQIGQMRALQSAG